jgi:hypothetical protein
MIKYTFEFTVEAGAIPVATYSVTIRDTALASAYESAVAQAKADLNVDADASAPPANRKQLHERPVDDPEQYGYDVHVTRMEDGER